MDSKSITIDQAAAAAARFTRRMSLDPMVRGADALADALRAFRALHKACTATGTRDTRCATCKTADTALRAAGRLP